MLGLFLCLLFTLPLYTPGYLLDIVNRIGIAIIGAVGRGKDDDLVANPDQAVFIYACANPAPHFGMLDRFLVIAEKRRIPAVDQTGS